MPSLVGLHERRDLLSGPTVRGVAFGGVEGVSLPQPSVISLVNFRFIEFRHVALSTSCSTTLGFFRNFQLVEQLSVRRETSKILCLYSHSHAPAASKKLKRAEYRTIACVKNIFVESSSFTIR